jgi:hypothetical protein
MSRTSLRSLKRDPESPRDTTRDIAEALTDTRIEERVDLELISNDTTVPDDPSSEEESAMANFNVTFRCVQQPPDIFYEILTMPAPVILEAQTATLDQALIISQGFCMAMLCDTSDRRLDANISERVVSADGDPVGPVTVDWRGTTRYTVTFTYHALCVPLTGRFKFEFHLHLQGQGVVEEVANVRTGVFQVLPISTDLANHIGELD